MPSFQALTAFKLSLNIARQLLAFEIRNFSDPPKTDEIHIVEGLRGGGAVLMVACFESYLRDVFEEYIDSLRSNSHKIVISKLPDEMQVTQYYQTLSVAMQGPKYSNKTRKIDRLIEIYKACGRIINSELYPQAFSDTNSNPRSAIVKTLFKNIGIPNIFSLVKTRFEKKSYWGMVVSDNFIGDKLDEIIDRRNAVAHTGKALNIARSDLRESIKFLSILAKLIDMELRKSARALKHTAI